MAATVRRITRTEALRSLTPPAPAELAEPDATTGRGSPDRADRVRALAGTWPTALARSPGLLDGARARR